MSTITKIYNAIRFFGLQPALKTIRYSLYRDRIQSGAVQSTSAESDFNLPGQASLMQSHARGGLLTFPGRQLDISFLAADLIRLEWLPGDTLPQYAIAKTDWPEVEVTATAIEDGWQFDTSEIILHVHRDAAIDVYSPTGELLRHEMPPRFAGNSVEHCVSLRPEEHISGLGMRAFPLNLRGNAYRLWNTDPGGSYEPGDDPLYVNIPVMFHMHTEGSILAFYDNIHDGIVDLINDVRIRFRDGHLRYYLIPGPIDRAINRYTELTGRPPMPPQWALGYHQSRWGYKSETQVRKIIDTFEELDLPVDVIHLDIDYMQGYRVFTINQDTFPNFKSMTADFKARGVHTVTILDPGVKNDRYYPVFREGLDKRVYVQQPDGKPLDAIVWPGWVHFPDFTSPACREWWGSYYAQLLELGVDGFWHDMNEPTSFSAWGDNYLPLNARHDFDGQGGTHAAGHNVYALLMNRSAFESLTRLAPQRRPWMLTRAASAGIQRYAWHWTGDCNSNWGNLRATVPMLLNLGLSGVSFSGSDIGGFSNHPSAEMYLRWFQLAAFSPFFRLHCATSLPEREPWHFPPEIVDAVRFLLQLRRKIQPYLYTLAWQAHQTGAPLVRPLFWSAPGNPDLWSIDDAFMLGDQLLVAPVLAEGQTSRSILLPPGEWFDYWTGQRHLGDGPLVVEAPLERIPLLIKAGSIFPMQHGTKLELHLYAPSGDGESNFTAYIDAGDGYGEHRLDTWKLTRTGSAITLEWQTQGEYPWPYETVDIHLHGFDANSAEIDGQPVEASQSLQPFKSAIFRTT